MGHSGGHALARLVPANIVAENLNTVRIPALTLYPDSIFRHFRIFSRNYMPSLLKSDAPQPGNVVGTYTRIGPAFLRR